MKKIILTALAVVAFQETPTAANPLQDFAAGLFFGTSPLFGHWCLYNALINFKKEGPRRAVVSVPSSLAGTYVWYKVGEYLRDNYELGVASYIIPALHFPLTMAGLRVMDARRSQKCPI